MKYFFLILLLCGCTTTSRWDLSVIRTGNAEHDTKKLVFKAHDSYNELDIELMQIDSDLSVFFCVHSYQIPAYLDDESKALVKVLTNDGEFEFIATRLAGAQKAYLKQEDVQTFLALLKQSSSITIELEGYRTAIEMASLAQFLRRFTKENFYFLPNDLIGIAL